MTTDTEDQHYPIYNMLFLEKLRNSTSENENFDYEKEKIMHAIDRKVSGTNLKMLQHVVPVLFNVICMIGTIVFVYKIII